MPSTRQSLRLVVIGLAIALAAGAFLRLHHLGRESFWLDEAWSAELAHMAPSEIAAKTAADVHPPLYYVALHYWARASGYSETGLRMFSVLASLGAIALLYAVAARLAGRATGLIAAGLAAISPFQVEFAQEARMYALLSLLAVASLYALVRLVARPSAITVSAYAVVTALLLYTHAYAVFVFGAEVAWLVVAVVHSRGRAAFAKPAALAQALAVVLFLPWLPIAMRQVFEVQRAFWIPEPATTSTTDTLVRLSGSDALAWVLAAMALVGAAIGLMRLRRGQDTARLGTPLVLLWLACPILAPLALSYVSTPIFLPKYTIAAAPAFLLLAARGISVIPSRVAIVAALVAIGVLSRPPLTAYYDSAHKAPWRDVASGIRAAAQPGDVAFFVSPYGQIPFDYYADGAGLARVPFLKYAEGMTTRALAGYVDAHLTGRDRAWVVLWQPSTLGSLAVSRLGETFHAVSHTAGRDLEVWLFERQAADGVTITADARAIQPGELAVLTITTKTPAGAVKVRAFDRDLAAYPVAPNVWRVLVGIDLDATVGPHRVSVDLMTGGAAVHASHTLTVTAKSFPTRTLTVDDAFVNPPASVTDRIAAESRLLERTWAASSAARLWTGPFVRPVDEAANSAFGSRSVFNGQARSPHSGADFLSGAGTPVKSPGAGRVVIARDLYYSGNTVIIDHGLGLFSLLAHLSKIDVVEGDVVTAGHVVGLVGATGRVTGAHLHWAVRAAGARVDPLSLLAVLGR